MFEGITRPYRVSIAVKKYNNGGLREGRDPDEVVTIDQWYEVDGSEITDPDRIQELEECVSAQMGE